MFLEPLELRCLPAVSLVGTVLTITGEFGSPVAGDYTIVHAAGYVAQNRMIIPVPGLASGAVTKIVYEGTARGDSYANLTQISDVVFGAAGNDRLSSGTGATAEIHGGEGNDLLIARARSCEVWGDAGADLYLTSVVWPSIIHRDAFDRN